MKHKFSAVILAAGLAVSAFSLGAAASETELDSEVVVAEESLSESIEEAEVESETAAAQTEAASIEDSVKTMLESYLTQLCNLSASEIKQYADMAASDVEELDSSVDLSTVRLMSNWSGVMNDLGQFESIETPVVTQTSSAIDATAVAHYSGVNDKTVVTVNYSFDMTDYSYTLSWDIEYPMGTLMAQAGMNTIMGVGVVFLLLLFFSFLIGKMSIVNSVFGPKKETKPAPKPAAPAPVPAAPAAEEEEYVDDTELVAVIAAAIAAAENTSADGFVVRSIRKANKKNWQRA